MGTADRIATTGGSDTAPGIGPKRVARNDAGTKTSRSAFGTGPADVITQENEFHTEASGRFDARGGQVVTITLADVTAGDEFVLTATEADNLDMADTIAFTAGTDMTAAAIQTALRSLLTGADLTVVTGDTDTGPFTVTFNESEFYSRRFPKLIVVSATGMSATITPAADPAVKRYLGETKYESTTELVGPTIGTITVTAGVDEIQTLTPGNGVDGGTVQLQFRRGRTGEIAYDATVTEIQAEIDAAFNQLQGTGIDSDEAPTVAVSSGSEVQTIDFGDMNTADTCKLTYNSVESTTTLTYNAAITAAQVQVLVDECAGAGEYVVTRTSNLVYVLTKQGAGAGASIFSVTSTATFTPKGTGGYVLGVIITTAFTAATGAVVFSFTFENGALAGMPIRGGLYVFDNEGDGSFTDGGVADTAVMAVATPGVLGSASAAYTEQATVGDSVFGEAVNDTTGKGYSAQKDTDSPAVFSGLPVGTYLCILRTVADKALSAPSTKAFTVTST